MKKLKPALIFSLILSLFLGSSNIANADSGASALPPKDPALNTYYYNLYAPKSQTTFKIFSTATQPVDRILQDASKLTMYGGILGGGGALASVLTPLTSNPYTALGIRVVNAIGGTMFIVGSTQQIAYQDFKKGSLVKHNVYFKWTNPARLEYAVKIDSWVSYNGMRVSELKTTNYTKTI